MPVNQEVILQDIVKLVEDIGLNQLIDEVVKHVPPQQLMSFGTLLKTAGETLLVKAAKLPPRVGGKRRRTQKKRFVR